MRVQLDLQNRDTCIAQLFSSEEAECCTQDDHSQGVDPVHVMPHCLCPSFRHRQISLLAKRQSRPQKGLLDRHTVTVTMGSSSLRAAHKRCTETGRRELTWRGLSKRSATARGRAWLLLCHTRFSRRVPEHPTPSWLQMIMCLQIQKRDPVRWYLRHCNQGLALLLACACC